MAVGGIFYVLRSLLVIVLLFLLLHCKSVSSDISITKANIFYAGKLSSTPNFNGLVHVRNDSSQSRCHCHLHSNHRFFFSSRLRLPCIFSTYLEISKSILDWLKIPAEFVPKAVVQINERSNLTAAITSSCEMP